MSKTVSSIGPKSYILNLTVTWWINCICNLMLSLWCNCTCIPSSEGQLTLMVLMCNGPMAGLWLVLFVIGSLRVISVFVVISSSQWCRQEFLEYDVSTFLPSCSFPFPSRSHSIFFPSPPLASLGEHCKLTQLCPGQRPSQKQIWCTLELPQSHWRQIRQSLRPLTSNRHHLSYDDCLENKGRLQDCSCSIGSYHCIQCYAHILWAAPTGQTDLSLSHWVHFTVLKCICVFVFSCISLHACCIIVTRWGGPGGIEAWSDDWPSSFSALTLLVGSHEL